MKRILMILILLSALYLCFAGEMIQPVASQMKSISILPENINLPPRDRTVYNFMIPPVTLLASYWDYMIGGYYSTPVRVQAANAGNGVFLTYMGQRTSSGQRRVFYSYIDHEGTVAINDEIPEPLIRQGYPSLDIDRETGKPIFAWHSDADQADINLEVSASLNNFMDGIPGPFGWSGVVIDNPVSFTINGDTYTDNEFIWPEVHIGPSPIPGQRRVFIFAKNAVTHSNNFVPVENVYYVYADFTPEMLASGDPLTWMHSTIPILDSWNTDITCWRRFFHTTVVGEDGNIYFAGYHVTQDPSGNEIHEPYLDVIMNTNYGEGDWIQYSADPDISVSFPMTDPPTELTYSIATGSHNSAYVTSDGSLHFPLIFGFESDDDQFTYPVMQYLKDVEFNTIEHTFLIHDLYPAGIHPNDGNPLLPWDINEDGIVDTTATGEVAITPSWPFMHWDETISSDAMIFNYNMVKFTRMNEQGMVAAVWSSSLNAKLYNENPEAYPELAPYMNVPEIFISVFPVTGADGPQWSEPICLNSINTPELNQSFSPPMIPEWVYPGDYIEYLGNTAEGYKVGKLHLLFFDDDEWGSWTPWENGSGRVMYAAMEIAWSPGQPVAGDIVGVSDPVTAVPSTLLQNYPNPFNPTTNISYNITKPGQVALNIFNIKGQKVRSLVNEAKPIGSFHLTWDGLSDNGSKVSSGVYFYRLENNGNSVTKKMVMIK